MKTSEIVVGATYTNRKGSKQRIRKVIGEGAEYVLYGGQADLDCIQYEIVADGTCPNYKKGTRGNMTRNSFARWAKERVG